MNRRNFLQVAALGSITTGLTATLAAAERYFPVKVDQALFSGINRVKDPQHKTPLERSHAPVISAPAAVKAGEPFPVEITVGESLHSMGPAHWIEYIEFSLGNEPAGRVDFQPKGYLEPKTVLMLVVPKEVAAAGKLTLVARQRCNLHGYWESSVDLAVA